MLTVPAEASDVASCCLDCDRARARQFKAGLPTKRVRVQIAPTNTSNRDAWVRYQTEKCGPLEYNIYDPNWFMSAVQHLTYELDPRNAIWADGLAADEPTGAPLPYRFPCCLLEAKYSQPNQQLALYVDRRTFVRHRSRKWWLRSAYDSYVARQALSGFLGRRFGRRPPRVDSFQVFAGRKWNEQRLRAVAQMAAYAAFCLSRETPFNVFVVIAGEERFVQAYFLPITPAPGRVAHARLIGPHWRT